ncbi:hypothetical protein L6R52_10480, partial [Myxococcota bacterium]|nr:hypothetical protein [Myxococcota bacterium]
MPKRPSLDPHEERLLVALVLEGEPEALGHFLSYFAPRLEDLWRRGAGRRFAREDLALDYVHWFLTDWLARPDGTWKNLRRFERQQARGFVDWWRARATWLWRDFHR